MEAIDFRIFAIKKCRFLLPSHQIMQNNLSNLSLCSETTILSKMNNSKKTVKYDQENSAFLESGNESPSPT